MTASSIFETDAKPGTPYARVAGLDDPTIEIAITPNRPDALGVRGVARDLVAAGLGKLKKDPLIETKGSGDCPIKIKVDNTRSMSSVCWSLDHGGQKRPLARLVATKRLIAGWSSPYQRAGRYDQLYIL